MPVFLFSISQVTLVDWNITVSLFIILHLIVYPSSNAYNSYMDKDEGSIGGIKKPPMATKQLYHVSLIFDMVGVAWAMYINYLCGVFVFLYIVASRLYSYRGVRLKKYPWIGWVIVSFFQGTFIYIMIQFANGEYKVDFWAALASSLLVGGVYPLTQIYQHEADAKDGVTTLSMFLGYRGTFMFTIGLFTLAIICLFVHFVNANTIWHFAYLNIFMFPVTLYFLRWMKRVWNNTLQANFENAMAMNIIASSCLNACFGLLIYFNHVA
jgi:1,4-dihydroxy-2-naphthoate polyprenyltransferase